MNPQKLDTNFPLLPVLKKFGFQIKLKKEQNRINIIFMKDVDQNGTFYHPPVML